MPSTLSLAAALVCSFEGFRAAPYQDTAGVWTIGYGTTRIDGEPVTADTPPIDQAAALAAMEEELDPDCASVSAHAPLGATPNQIAACTSFAYNEGISAFLGSTLLHLWLQGDVAGAAAHFMDWIYDHDPVTHQLVEVAGLKNRRLREMTVFLGAPPG